MTTATEKNYNDDIVRMFTIAAVFWGVVGFTMGVIIALQMAFPHLNVEPYLNFGRLRPVHTSAVIRRERAIGDELLRGPADLRCALMGWWFGGLYILGLPAVHSYGGVRLCDGDYPEQGICRA